MGRRRRPSAVVHVTEGPRPRFPFLFKKWEEKANNALLRQAYKVRRRSKAHFVGWESDTRTSDKMENGIGCLTFAQRS